MSFSLQHGSTHPNAASKVVAVMICILLGLLPITMLTELRGGSANFWVLLAFSLAACSLREGGIRAALQSLRPYRILTLALLVMPLTVAMASLWSHHLLEQDTERAVRVFVGTLVILAACSVCPFIYSGSGKASGVLWRACSAALEPLSGRAGLISPDLKWISTPR